MAKSPKAPTSGRSDGGQGRSCAERPPGHRAGSLGAPTRAHLTSLDQGGQGENEANEESGTPGHHDWEQAQGPGGARLAQEGPRGRGGEELGRRSLSQPQGPAQSWHPSSSQEGQRRGAP